MEGNSRTMAMRRTPWRALLFSALMTAPVQAAPTAISPAQQAAIFPQQKQLVLRDQRDRLAIIQASLRCANDASDTNQLMGCLVQEHQQSQRLNAEHHSAMLAILRQHGVVPATSQP